MSKKVMLIKNHANIINIKLMKDLSLIKNHVINILQGHTKQGIAVSESRIRIYLPVKMLCIYLTTKLKVQIID